MKKTIIISIILILAVSLSLMFIKKNGKPKEELELYGNIEIRQVDLSFRVQGQIEEMFVEEGDKVEKGQILAKLDDVTFEADYKKSLADVALNRAVSLNALDKYTRHIPLCQDGTTSKRDCDDFLNTKNSSQASLEASIQASKVAQKNLDDTVIKSPANGVIMTRVQEPGAVVSPTQPVYTMAKTEPVWVRAYIPEPNLANIKYGMKTKVFTDTTNPETGEKRQYVGQVGYISPVAEFTPKTVQTTDLRTDLVYRIRVYIFDVDDYLRQGMPVTIKVSLKKEGEEVDVSESSSAPSQDESN